MSAVPEDVKALADAVAQASWMLRQKQAFEFADDLDRKLADFLAARPSVPPVPDMRAVCEALGFDPTNHHSAATCPYCSPVPPVPDAQDLQWAAEQVRDMMGVISRSVHPDAPSSGWHNRQLLREVERHGEQIRDALERWRSAERKRSSAETEASP